MLIMHRLPWQSPQAGRPAAVASGRNRIGSLRRLTPRREIRVATEREQDQGGKNRQKKTIGSHISSLIMEWSGSPGFELFFKLLEELGKDVTKTGQ